ncbi:ABC transporter substrate-binding protein [Agromyces silvae]|uniref:ABC transporter substrate-binding protein n=1 Tax=Agromyces silvae TaxID=3388266 RepID=UPI00280AB2B0|nr:ABC transporter substrate-binding protein [Agromyces protaetiae]
MRKRLLAATTVVAATMLFVTGCTSDPAPAPEATGPTSANVYLYQKPVSFNPLKSAQGAEQLTMSLVFDNLLTTNPDFEFEPRLAESWDVSDDARTFTFHLREGLTWSDGEPFTADDVVFSYNAFADPAVGSAWSSRLSGVEGYAAYQDGSADSLAGVTAVDENTVEIVLSEPNAGFLSVIGYGTVFFIMPEHVLADADRATLLENEFFDLPNVGMGPYVMDAFQVDQQIELSANENYRTDVGIDTLYLKMVTSDVATAQLGTGELDLVQVSPLDMGTVETLPGVTVEASPSAGFNRLGVNGSKPYLADPRVRQALVQAIDRQGIIDGVLGGYASALNTSIMTPWAIPDDLDEYEYDADAAAALLAEAGWDPAQEIALSWVPGQRDRDQMATVIIENLQAAGVNAVANQVDAGMLTDSYRNMTFDLVLFGGGVYTPDPASTFPIFSCVLYPTGGNMTQICDEELDAAMKAGAATADQEVRAESYQEAARLENANVPYIWLNVPDTIWATTERLQGFVPHGDFTNGFWNAADWTVTG